MKALLVLVFAFVFCTGSFSQTKVPGYALSFGIADNFNLKSFNMDIAVKKVFADNNQLRLFLSPRLNNSKNDSENLIGYRDEVDNNTFSVGIGADYLWYFLKEGDIRLYSGPGLSFTYSGGTLNRSQVNNLGRQIDEEDTNETALALRGILGVEWMVGENIGLHSEYILSGSYRSSKIEHVFRSDNDAPIKFDSKVNGFNINTGVLFGVSIYF